MDYVTTILLLSLILYALSWISRTSKKRAAPQAGGSWPLIGHLHLLGGPQPPHIVLGNMADKYGPVFTIKMGVHRALVVSNWEMAKECLTTNDKAFANRPKFLAGQILGYDGAMFGFSQYGPYWRQIRKTATTKLLSTHRLEMLKNVQESEVRVSLKELYKYWDRKKSSSNNNKVLAEMKRWFGDINLNVICRIIVGKSVGYATSSIIGGDDQEESTTESWKKQLREFFDWTGRFLVSDALPFLRFLDIGGQERTMKKIAKDLDHVVEGWLEEHMQKRVNNGGGGDHDQVILKEEEDFMDLMLSILDEADAAQSGRDSRTINKATCLALILGASDTTTVSLTWMLSLLVNNPRALKKAQDELDLNVGRERQIEESDLQNLVYLQAIIQETLRLYPAGPLSIPHESMEDCDVGGYNIPKGTRLLVNISKIHRDPRVWPDPHEFQPERFLTTHKNFDVKGQNFEYIPFGSGRRMCPGVSFALQVMQLTMAVLLHGFDFATPSGEPIDMTESIGLTNIRATPLEIVLNPRLPTYLY